MKTTRLFDSDSFQSNLSLLQNCLCYPCFGGYFARINIRRELTEGLRWKNGEILITRVIFSRNIFFAELILTLILCDGRYGRLHSLTLDMRLVNTSYYLPITTLSDDMKTPKLISKNITGTLRRSSICFLSMVNCFLQKA